MRAAGLNPFDVLGLDRDRELTDDDVRNAWRRIAAATHPDRPDGGDAGRFAAAAAAYSELRTAWSRGEAKANLADARTARARPGGRTRSGGGAAGDAVTAALFRMAALVAAAAAFIALALLAAGRGPAGPALAVGAATWLAASLRRMLRAGLRGRPGGDGAGRVRGPLGPGTYVKGGGQAG